MISQTDVNAEMDDIATALTASLAKDGQTVPTANLPMGGYKLTGVGNGSARTDYAAMGQVQDGKVNWVDGGGTADAITATYSPVITALVDGQVCNVRATAANATTTPTFAPNGLTARTIVKAGGGALVAGNISADGHELILRYDLTNTRWELLNPVETATTLAVLPKAGGTMTGDITMSGASIFDANASIAAHATTMDPWSLGNYVTLTGGAVTFTALANAPQAGAEVELYMNAAHVWTDGAVFEVDGDANWTAEAGDRVRLRAKSTTVFTVQPIKKTGRAVIATTPIFTAAYDSGDQTITAAGTLTLAHSLGASPKIVQCLLKCNDAGGDIGYANGDYVFINTTGGDGGSTAISTGVSIIPDATNLNVRFGSDAVVFLINRKDTGALNSITASKWKFIVRAYV